MADISGTRLRERRIALGVRQNALAQKAGISPAYLNLIEHNRRNIGGRLLNRLAAALDTDPEVISQGAGSAIVEALDRAANEFAGAGAETSRTTEFAERFPGWAALVVELRRRVAEQDRGLAAMADRLAHDPQLAAAMHEILSVATSIRSTAGILSEDTNMAEQWLRRFHRNLYEDSQRLADSSTALADYLDVAEDQWNVPNALPRERFDQWLEARDFFVREMEAGDADVDAFVSADPELSGNAALRTVAVRALRQYRDDAARLPRDRLTDVLAEGADPLGVAEALSIPLSLVFRRLATLSFAESGPFGLVACDSSGAIIMRRPLDGFVIPRLGEACPIWPLFQALSRPNVPIRFRIEQAGHMQRKFVAYAVAEPLMPPSFDGPEVYRSTMLLQPDTSVGEDSSGTLVVGANCRICPKANCKARRERSELPVPAS